MLGVEFNVRRIPRSDYNPIRNVASGIPPEFLFLAYDPKKPEDRNNRPFSQRDPVTRMLRHVLMPFAGSLDMIGKTNFEIMPLIWTTRASGYVERVDVFPKGRVGFGSQRMSPDENRPVIINADQYDLAVRITGELPPIIQQQPVENADGKPDAVTPAKINVILVADVDMVTPVFYMLRQQGTDPRLGTNFTFDNVTFIMNAIDSLAGDERFLSVRGRRPEHRALDKFLEMTHIIDDNVAKQREQARNKFKETIKTAQKEMRDNVDKLALELQEKSERLTMQELLSRVKAMEMAAQKKLEAQTEELQRELTQKELELEVQRQDDLRYQQGVIKALAIMIPPTPLLLLASAVFFQRGMRETVGTSKKRLRSGKR
jgi:ABC-2 type transport system permease protein